MTETQNNEKNEEYIDSLRDEISYLREILASKLFEEDNLINFTCREIETDYSLKFGVYKYKIKDYKLKIKKTKRTIELIKKMVNQQSANQFNKEEIDLEENQIKINKTKINKPKINMSEIERHIENEFKEEDLELQTETAKVNILIEEHKNNLSKKQDFKELHTIYKDCIRKIHPDLLLEPTDYEENLFYSSKEAYEDRDLDELKSAQNLIGRHEIENEPITVEDFDVLYHGVSLFQMMIHGPSSLTIRFYQKRGDLKEFLRPALLLLHGGYSKIKMYDKRTDM